MQLIKSRMSITHTSNYESLRETRNHGHNTQNTFVVMGRLSGPSVRGEIICIRSYMAILATCLNDRKSDTKHHEHIVGAYKTYAYDLNMCIQWMKQYNAYNNLHKSDKQQPR